MEPDAVEIRVIGCLLEKQRTTPDVYPLSLSSLRQACNQASNRDPVVDYEEAEVGAAVRRLTLREWVRIAGESGSRVQKYRHRIDEVFDLGAAELSLLAVLMLRGAQTPGELKQRTDRLYGFDDLMTVHETLNRLIEKRFVIRHERRRGQKEARYEQRLGAEPGGEERGRVGAGDGGYGTAEVGGTGGVEVEADSGAVVSEDAEMEQGNGGGADLRGVGAEEVGAAVEDADVGADGSGSEGKAAVRTEEMDESYWTARPNLGGEAPPPSPPPTRESESSEELPPTDPRVDWLEAEVVKLRAQLAALMEALGEDPKR
jgi:uncharacterized protein YceH (UPF0502 family)